MTQVKLKMSNYLAHNTTYQVLYLTSCNRNIGRKPQGTLNLSRGMWCTTSYDDEIVLYWNQQKSIVSTLVSQTPLQSAEPQDP
jgi:hypothetical protein